MRNVAVHKGFNEMLVELGTYFLKEFRNMEPEDVRDVYEVLVQKLNKYGGVSNTQSGGSSSSKVSTTNKIRSRSARRCRTALLRDCPSCCGTGTVAADTCADRVDSACAGITGSKQSMSASAWSSSSGAVQRPPLTHVQTATSAGMVRALVAECCPELSDHVDAWLTCYKDPALLYASLLQEYRGTSLDDKEDDDADFSTASGSKTMVPIRSPPLMPAMQQVSGEGEQGREAQQGQSCTSRSTNNVVPPSLLPPLLSGDNRMRACPSDQQHSERFSLLELMPSNIGFCHDSVANTFRNGKHILDTVRELIDGTLRLRDVPMMRVVLYEEEFYSMSNRRLCIYRLCQHLGLITEVTPVKVQLLEALPEDFRRKFTTPCKGAWVRVRNDGRFCCRTLEETTFGRELLS